MTNVQLTPAVEMFPEYERERVRVQEVRYLIAMEDVDAISEDLNWSMKRCGSGSVRSVTPRSTNASAVFSAAAALRLSVEQALMSAVPGLRATIQLLPSDVEAHAGDERDPL